MITATEALERLREGNKRYVNEAHSYESYSFEQQRARLVDRQAPFAVVLGCSDSRVPSELVFDQGLGDLFVVRVAGNVAAPSQIGSTEFAVAQLGARLVVVLGHSNCGAVVSTIKELQQPSGNLTPSLLKIVERIQPSVEAVLANASADPLRRLEDVVKANVLATVETLRRESPVLSRHEAEQGLMIVGAEYSLETGEVEFF